MKSTSSSNSGAPPARMIPVCEPLLGDAERAALAAAATSGQIASGPMIETFEQSWSAYCGRTHGVAVTNGTVALQLAVAALDLPAGSEIIMPSFTIISCALAAIYNGLVPRFVDADPMTWCMDVAATERAIGPATRAILAVHTYGHPVDAGPLLRLARERNIPLIEDAAEAHGAEVRVDSDHGAVWQRCGSLGAVSCFSFYANKLITTGEGGMLLTDNPDIAARARLLRNLGFDPARRFRHEHLGFNFRMTNLQAALGVPQVARIDEIVARKRSIASAYAEALSDLRGLTLPHQASWARSVYWMYGIVLDPATGLDGAELGRRLADMGIETRPFFLGLHEQPALVSRGLGGHPLPVTEMLSRQGLYLPSGLGLTAGQIETVARAVRRSLT
jgi:perosamine synthetase